MGFHNAAGFPQHGCEIGKVYSTQDRLRHNVDERSLWPANRVRFGEMPKDLEGKATRIEIAAVNDARAHAHQCRAYRQENAIHFPLWISKPIKIGGVADRDRYEPICQAHSSSPSVLISVLGATRLSALSMISRSTVGKGGSG